jgi:hypothetical protein
MKWAYGLDITPETLTGAASPRKRRRVSSPSPLTPTKGPTSRPSTSSDIDAIPHTSTSVAVHHSPPVAVHNPTTTVAIVRPLVAVDQPQSTILRQSPSTIQ